MTPFHPSLRRIMAVCLAALLVSGPGAAHSTAHAQAAPAALGVPAFRLPVGVTDGSLSWADYDNDNDQDLLLAGMTATGQPKTSLLRNDGDHFTEIDLGLQPVQAASASWGDYDNDGYLDLLLTGQVSVDASRNPVGFAGVYHNQQVNGQRGFVLRQRLPNIYQGAGVWGDYTQGGRLDLLLTGTTDGGLPLSQLYYNNGNGSPTGDVFTLDGLILPGLRNSAAAFGDFDQDGYLDFALSGRRADGSAAALVYHNNGTSGFDAPNSLPTGTWNGTLHFIDDNADGNLDLLLTGNTGGDRAPNIHPQTLLYRFRGSTAPYFQLPLASAATGLPDLWNSSVTVGDFDNDGFPDLALNGMTATNLPTRIYHNNHNGTFADTYAGLPNGSGVRLAWGHASTPSVLDLAVTGIGPDAYQTEIYPVAGRASNAAPSRPTLRSGCWDPATGSLTVKWIAPADDHTPTRALSYNLALGTSPAGAQTANPPADRLSGFARLAEMGNAFTGNSAVLRGLADGDYYPAVQAVDGAYAGGAFTAPTEAVVFRVGTAVAVEDKISVHQNVPASFPVLTNDSADGQTLAIDGFTPPEHGRASILYGQNGQPDQLLYTPNGNYTGPDRLYYDALRLPSRTCSRTQVTIDVKPYNSPPSALTLDPAAVLRGAPAQTLVGRLSVTDFDAPFGETYTYNLTADAGGSDDNAAFTISGSQLLLNTVAAGSAYQVHVRAAENTAEAYAVEQTFTVQVTDRTPPSLGWLDGTDIQTSSPSVTISEDGLNTADQPTPFRLALAATDAGSTEMLSWSLASLPAHGSAALGGTTRSGQPQNGLTYSPSADYFGPDALTVRVSDPFGDRAELLVSITVQPVNDPPTLDPIPDILLRSHTGAQIITLPGLSAGPANESGQTLTFTLTPAGPNGPLLDAQIAALPGANNAALTLHTGDAVGRAEYLLTIDDGQPDHALLTRSVSVRVDYSHPVWLAWVTGE